jgi:hypothetical protein
MSCVRQVTDKDHFCSTGKDELLETAMALHDAAMKDDYFVSRKLAPNVDFWSGLIYRAMGECLLLSRRSLIDMEPLQDSRLISSRFCSLFRELLVGLPIGGR